MKGRIIRIEEDKIIIRPKENFLDVVVNLLPGTKLDKNALHIEQEADIEIGSLVNVIIGGMDFFGILKCEDK